MIEGILCLFVDSKNMERSKWSASQQLLH